MLLLLSSAALLLCGLAVERVRLDRSRRVVPLRIAVTGTRGKTTVARTLAAVLREGGGRVLAKTTGSEPTLVLPDGSVRAVRRRGRASILEQKALIHRAARAGADTLVAEAMSIHAENHEVEGRRILAPHLVLVTNFRVDHTEAQGHAPDSVAAVLARGVPEGAKVFLPQGEDRPAFRVGVESEGGTVVAVPPGVSGSVVSPGPRLSFQENLDLVVAVARTLGLDDATIRRGVEKTRHDAGALRMWRLNGSEGAGPVHLVAAFAANDPESTLQAYDGILERLSPSRPEPSVPKRPGEPAPAARPRPGEPAPAARPRPGEPAPAARPRPVEPAPAARPRPVGLLSLRADRGDRTLQWADALASGALHRFEALFVVGLHGAALARRVRRGLEARRDGSRAAPTAPPLHVLRPTSLHVLRPTSPRELTRATTRGLDRAGGVVFGFGNMGGVGEELVAYWSRVAEEVGIGR